jgi:ribonuclease BN (tRNA processing enzyme)
MIKWLIELFENDWSVIEVKRGTWDITGRDYNEYSVYEILYSSSKNEYKLKLSGYKPKENSTYIEAVERLNELKNGK